MNRYPIRVVKYAIYITVIFAIVMGAFYLIYGESMAFDTFQTTNGKIMLIFLAILLFIFPKINYISRTMVFDASKRAEQVDKVMDLCGYVKAGDDSALKTYRAKSFIKRLNLMFEDQITIETTNEISVMTGPRKEVTKAQFRMDTLIRSEQE